MRNIILFISFIGALITTAAGVSPKVATSNLSGWYDLIGDAPSWMESKSVDEYGFYIGMTMFIGSVIAMIIYKWPKKTPPDNVLDETKYGNVHTDKRIPLIELRDLAEKNGWDFSNMPKLNALEFAKELRQAGLDGRIIFWGRPRKYSDEKLNLNEPLHEIDSEHWKGFTISGLIHVREEDIGTEENNYVQSCNSFSSKKERFIDLYVNKKTSISWLRKITNEYKEINDMGSKPHSDEPHLISLPKACTHAYEETQETYSALQAEKTSEGDAREILNWYACAITGDGGATLYGSKPPSEKARAISKKIFGNHTFYEGATRFAPYGDKNIGYHCLAVMSDELKTAIAQIKTWGT